MQNLMDIMIGKISELSEAPEWRNLGFKMAVLAVNDKNLGNFEFELLAGKNHNNTKCIQRFLF